MAEQIKDKVPLNRVTHSVRAAQAVLQFVSVRWLILRIKHWLHQRLSIGAVPDKIFDDPFCKSIGSRLLCKPTDISYVRFPEWYFCPKCRDFKPLSQWFLIIEKKHAGNC